MNYPGTANPASEIALLSIATADAGARADLLASLGDADFATRKGRAYFRAIQALDASSTEPDDLTLAEQLAKDGQLETVGGPGDVAALIDSRATIPTFEHHLRNVRKSARRRRLVVEAEKLLVEAQATDLPDDFEDVALQRLTAAVADCERGGPRPLASFTDAGLDEISARATGQSAAIPFGFPDLDAVGPMLSSGTLTIIGALPSVGKTALGLAIARNAAIAGKAVVLFSLEMSWQELFDRIISVQTGIPLAQIRAGSVDEDDWRALANAAEKFQAWPLAIDDNSTQTPERIRRICRAEQAKGGCDLVIVDYLTLLESKGGRNRNQNDIVAEQSRALKLMAKALGVPVIVLSQLNRSSKIDNREPQKHDLRDSGAIEQDADNVLLLHRLAPDTTKVIVDKQRNGSCGHVKLRWVEELATFRSLDGATS